MRKSCRKLLILMALALTAGCSPFPSVPRPSESETAPTKAFYSVAENTITPTSSSTSKPSASLMATSTPYAVHVKCVDMQASTPRGFVAGGKIILVDYDLPKDLFGLTPTDNETFNITKFGQNIFYPNPVVSPNKRVLAYVDYVGNNASKLILADSNANIMKTVSWPDNWGTVVGWLNDTELAISLSTDAMMILNPFTGVQENISFDQFPNFNFILKTRWVVYDPSLKRAVYPTGGNQVLLGLDNMQSLAKIPDGISRPPDASWTEDGSYVAIVGSIFSSSRYVGDELFAVSRDGDVKQLTHLNYYGTGIYLRSPRWSPDGKQIAFWLTDPSNNPLYVKLEVVDLDTQQVTNYCISSYPYTEAFGGNLPVPIWSPDSTQIIVENRMTTDHNTVLLVDISKGISVKIAEDARPIGWMLNEP